MNTTIFVCPYAQFGNPGTMAGAELLADAIRELLDDNDAETRPHRAKAYRGKVKVEELPLATSDDYTHWHARAREAANAALDAGEFLIWIGGNHLSVLPLYAELGSRTGSLVVQADAHLDVYHYRDCVAELSHGNFLRSLKPAPKIINVGHRDLFLPAKEINKYFAATYSITDLTRDEAGILAAIDAEVNQAAQTLLDIDWDVLDPAYFPAVDDALPFGMTPLQLLRLTEIVRSKKCCGIAMSEFNPGRDRDDRSLSLAIWLVEHVLLLKH